MKKIFVFLALSLAANAAFLVTYIARTAPKAAGSVPVGETPVRAAANRTTAASLSPVDTAALQRANELLGGTDVELTVARLRAAGFSAVFIRAFVQTEVNEEFGERRAALVREQGKVPFWQTRDNGMWIGDQKMVLAFAALGREQAARTKQLLGADAAAQDGYNRAMTERMFGGLSAEKIDRLQSIANDYSELQAQINSEARGIMLPEDRDKMVLLQQEQRADIEKLLTPQELEDYDLRNSSVSHRLRFQLAGFNPSEEEFRTIFRLTQAAEGANGAGNRIFPPSPADRASQQAGQAKLQQDIAAALGGARMAEYQLSINPEYQQVNRLLTRLDLPSSIAPQIVSVQEDIQRRANSLRIDQSLSVDDRASELAALGQEAETRLTAALGARGFSAYRATTGHWLNGLTPRQVSTVPQPAVMLPRPGG